MSKVIVEEINKIELDSKSWWQPEIDKQTFKRLLNVFLSISGCHHVLESSSILLISSTITFDI